MGNYRPPKAGRAGGSWAVRRPPSAAGVRAAAARLEEVGDLPALLAGLGRLLELPLFLGLLLVLLRLVLLLFLPLVLVLVLLLFLLVLARHGPRRHGLLGRRPHGPLLVLLWVRVLLLPVCQRRALRLLLVLDVLQVLLQRAVHARLGGGRWRRRPSLGHAGRLAPRRRRRPAHRRGAAPRRAGTGAAPIRGAPRGRAP